jgi:hypothetical protein
MSARALLALELRRIGWKMGNAVRELRSVLLLVVLLGALAWLAHRAVPALLAEMRTGAEAVRSAGTLHAVLAGEVAMGATFLSVLALISGLNPAPQKNPQLARMLRLREQYLRGAGVPPGVLAVREVAGQLLWQPLVALLFALLIFGSVWLLLAPLHRALLVLALTAVLLLGVAAGRVWRFGGVRGRLAVGVPLGVLALQTLLYSIFAEGHFAPELKRAVLRWDFHLAPWRLLLGAAAGPLACVLLFAGALVAALSSARWAYARMGWEMPGGAAADGAAAESVEVGGLVVVRGPVASLVLRDARRLTRLSTAERLALGYFLLIPLLQFVFLSWQSPAVVQTLLDPARVHWLGTVVGVLPAISLSAVLWDKDTRATWAWHRTTLAAPERLVELRAGVLGVFALLYVVLLAGLAFAAGGGAGAFRLMLWALPATAAATCATALTTLVRLRLGQLGSPPAQIASLLIVVALSAAPGLLQAKTGHPALALALALLLAGTCIRAAAVLFRRAEFLPANA